MSRFVVGLSVLALILAVAAGAGAADAPGAGLAVHYYADPVFWTYGGEITAPAASMTIDLNHLTWPAGGTRTGWSVAAYGLLQVPAAGDYLFKSEGPRAELWLACQTVERDWAEPLRP